MAVADLLVKIGADVQEFQKSMKEVGSSIESSGQKMRSLGMSLTASVTAPIVGVGVAAFKASTDFNEAMANVATLIPGQKERINDLKDTVQDMAIEFGKSTQDLAGGLYQIISAFGDTADTVKILEISTQAAAAGLSTVNEAVALTSAITKAYGDTSAEAVQKVSDLALQTVVLGQTTFPELANAMGRVTPIAEALNVTQEELFGTMATLTGVTGGTNEVVSQLRMAFQAIMKPTADMQMALSGVLAQIVEQGKITGPLADEYKNLQKRALELSEAMLKAEEAGDTTQYNQLKKALEENAKAQGELAASAGPTIVELLGLQDALGLIANQAQGNTNTLGKMFGSVEGLNAVLALTGPQADMWNEKVGAMGDVAGATTAAFEEQMQGVNAAGVTWEQLKEKFIVVAQKIGDALIPGLVALMDAAEPLLNLIKSIAEWFGNLPDPMKKAAVGFAAVVAAIGPVLTIGGQFQTTIGKVITVLSGLSGALKGIPALIATVGTGFKTVGTKLLGIIGTAGPWGLAIAGIVAGVALIIKYWEPISEFFVNLWNGIADVVKKVWGGIKDFLSSLWDGIKDIASKAWEGIQFVLTAAWEGLIASGKVLWNGFKDFFGGLWEGIKDITVKAWEGISNIASKAWEGIQFVLTAAWEGLIASGKVLWNGFKDFFGDLWEGIKDITAKAWDGIKSVLGKAWEGIKSMAESIWGGISGFFGGIWDTITGKGKGAEIEAIKQEIGFDNYENAADNIDYHTVPELELPIFDTQSLNNFDADMGDLRANQIIMDIHDNKISDELDIEKIGDQLVHRLYRAGVA